MNIKIRSIHALTVSSVVSGEKTTCISKPGANWNEKVSEWMKDRNIFINKPIQVMTLVHPYDKQSWIDGLDHVVDRKYNESFETIDIVHL